MLPDAANMSHSGQLSELQTDAPVSLTLSPDEVRDVAVPLVLIADASPASRTRRSQQLETRGFRVSVARTGFEAIVKACCNLPDFILMDESLGEDDVAETMTLLATCPATSHIPIARLGPGRRLPVRMLSSVVRHR